MLKDILEAYLLEKELEFAEPLANLPREKTERYLISVVH
jgi:hypothetical protein